MADTHTVFNKLYAGKPNNVLSKYGLTHDHASKDEKIITHCNACGQKYAKWTNKHGQNVFYCMNKKCKEYRPTHTSKVK
jgi:hypothetical protein